MRLSAIFSTLGVFAAAGGISLVTAYFSVQIIENASVTDVLTELDRDGLTWAEVDTDGLQVYLIGTAPDEAARFRALSVAGRVVDAARVIDQMLVEEPEDIAPPRFSLEILRNASGISVIGLVPLATDRDALLAQFRRAAGGDEVSDLLEAADFPPPDGWEDALDFATQALRDLPRSKISVEATRVEIIAMTESLEARQRLETALSQRTPDALTLSMDLSAPRPVISPFSLRFVIDGSGARFDACSTDTEEGRSRILRAAARAWLEGKIECRLGLGVPSRHWTEAVELGLSKLAEIGTGSITFTNADITLQVPEGTDRARFDRVVGELETALPDVFVLHAILPVTPETNDEGPPEFIATLSPEGAVQLRGRLSSDIARTTADSYARARFGTESVYTAARVADNLPRDWSVRALAGLEALSMLSNGAVTVTPDNVTVTGKTGNAEANTQISALLVSKLGEQAAYDIRVEYVEQLDPLLGLPTPEECEMRIVSIIGTRKISFEPGSTTFDTVGESIMDDLSELLKTCGDIPLEIGGHTDSQGRESMNQQLSQERAQAVLDALRERLVPVRSYEVRGYGEVQPIADNGTEEGREANRRIEFRLLRTKGPEGPQDTEAPADSDDRAPATQDPDASGAQADAAPAAQNNAAPASQDPPAEGQSDE